MSSALVHGSYSHQHHSNNTKPQQDDVLWLQHTCRINDGSFWFYEGYKVSVKYQRWWGGVDHSRVQYCSMFDALHCTVQTGARWLTSERRPALKPQTLSWITKVWEFRLMCTGVPSWFYESLHRLAQQLPANETRLEPHRQLSRLKETQQDIEDYILGRPLCPVEIKCPSGSAINRSLKEWLACVS